MACVCVGGGGGGGGVPMEVHEYLVSIAMHKTKTILSRVLSLETTALGYIPCRPRFRQFRALHA